MKYCTHCGAELLDEAVVCPKCGCWANSITSTTAQQKGKLNACALVGFILSMAAIILFFLDFMGLLALAGMVVSIVGLAQLCRSDEQKGKSFAVAGIAVGACLFLFGVIFWIALLA